MNKNDCDKLEAMPKLVNEPLIVPANEEYTSDGARVISSFSQIDNEEFMEICARLRNIPYFKFEE